MQLKHLACVWVKDLLILMEAYCLCCNSLVLDVDLSELKQIFISLVTFVIFMLDVVDP